MLEPTGERLSEKVFTKIMVEHVQRYAFVSAMVAGRHVLDIASGEGYGANLLAKTAAFVYGIDQSMEAVIHAASVYRRDNIQFLSGDVTNIPLPVASIDVVTSFETIEHLHEHDAMIAECKRVMKGDGIMIISTPDKHYYSDLPCYSNPYHVKELYEADFISLLSRYFCHVQLYRQGIVKAGLIYRQDQPGASFCIQHGSFDHVDTDGQIYNPEYMIIVASDSPVPALPDSLFESHAIDANMAKDLEKYKKRYDAIIQSRTYKLVRLISSPWRWFKF